MNRFSLLLTLACLVTGTRVARAQMPHPHSLSLDAQATSAGGTVRNSQGTSTSSSASHGKKGGFNHTLSTTSTQTTSSKQSVQISLRNFGVMPDTAHVEWYFIATPVTPDPDQTAAEQQFAFDQGAKDVSLAGNGTDSFVVDSQEVTSTTKRSHRSRMSNKGKINKGKGTGVEDSGNKLSGWVVRVVADGKVVASKASSTSLEEVAKDEKRFQELISE